MLTLPSKGKKKLMCLDRRPSESRRQQPRQGSGFSAGWEALSWWDPIVFVWRAVCTQRSLWSDQWLLMLWPTNPHSSTNTVPGRLQHHQAHYPLFPEQRCTGGTRSSYISEKVTRIRLKNKWKKELQPAKDFPLMISAIKLGSGGVASHHKTPTPIQLRTRGHIQTVWLMTTYKIVINGCGWSLGGVRGWRRVNVPPGSLSLGSVSWKRSSFGWEEGKVLNWCATRHNEL